MRSRRSDEARQRNTPHRSVARDDATQPAGTMVLGYFRDFPLPSLGPTGQPLGRKLDNYKGPETNALDMALRRPARVVQAEYLNWDTDDVLSWLRSLHLDGSPSWPTIVQRARELRLRGDDLHSLGEPVAVKDLGVENAIHVKRVTSAAVKLVYRQTEHSLFTRISTLEQEAIQVRMRLLCLERMSLPPSMHAKITMWDSSRFEVPAVRFSKKKGGRNACICGRYEAVVLYEGRPLYKKHISDYVFYSDGFWRVTQGLENVAKGACAARVVSSTATPYTDATHRVWEVYQKWSASWVPDSSVATVCVLNLRCLTRIIRSIAWIQKMFAACVSSRAANLRDAQTINKNVCGVIYLYYEALMAGMDDSLDVEPD